MESMNKMQGSKWQVRWFNRPP